MGPHRELLERLHVGPACSTGNPDSYSETSLEFIQEPALNSSSRVISNQSASPKSRVDSLQCAQIGAAALCERCQTKSRTFLGLFLGPSRGRD